MGVIRVENRRIRKNYLWIVKKKRASLKRNKSTQSKTLENNWVAEASKYE